MSSIAASRFSRVRTWAPYAIISVGHDNVRIPRNALEQEEHSTEPQGLPALMDRAARFTRFNDDSRVRQQRHRAIAHREALRRGLGRRIKLRDQQVIAADRACSSAFSFG